MIKSLVYQSMRLDLRSTSSPRTWGWWRQTSDHMEGVQAFKDKRPRKFTGR
jgi:hypothetical protein